MKKIKPEITNEATEKGTILTLSGSVRKSYFDEDENLINMENIKRHLDDVKGHVTIRLNSGGGDVFEGIEIYNYLKDLDNHVTIEVTALAASAASIIAMAGDEVVMNIGASMMIHEASTFAWGTKTDIKKTLNALETIDDSIASIYQAKTDKELSVVEEWVTEETWFTADEAVEAGLADKKKKEEPTATASVQIDTEKIAEIVRAQINEVAAEAGITIGNQKVQKITGLNKLFNKKGE